MTVEVRLLGPVGVHGADGRERTVRAPRERALLGVLALGGPHGVSVDRIVSALWGPDPPASARNAVQVYVSHLRRTIGRDLVLSTDDGYRLHEAVDVDVVRFDALARAGRAALAAGTFDRAHGLLCQALDLWRGDALGGCGDAVFSSSERDRLDESRLLAVEDRCAAAAGLTPAGADVVAELRDLVARHPFRERLWAMLVRALYRGGRRADALAAFAQARTVLVDELGIEPGPELSAVHAAVLADDAALAPATSSQSPHMAPPPMPLTSLVGRSLQVNEAAALLADERVRLLSLLGPGGVGKTRLALAAAAQVGTKFGDGVCWVPLASVGGQDGVRSAVAEALGLRGPDAWSSVMATLAGRDLLLVLDNAEHVLDACAAVVAELLATLPGVTVMCTSRTALRVPGEQRFRVPPLPVGTAHEPGSAIALFTERASDVTARAGLDPDGVAELCALLDGLPLALEIAASRTTVLSLGQLREQLVDRLSLTTRSVGVEERHRSLRAVLDWSHALLAEEDKALLACLSVFRGGFTLDGAAAVTGRDGAVVVDGLDTLLEASLLTRSDGPAGPRLTMLESVRQFADEQLTARGDGDDVRRRHALHMVALVTAPWTSTPPLKNPRTRTDLEVLEAERQNLLVAIERARAEADVATLADLVVCPGGWWLQTTPIAEVTAWLDEVIAGPVPDHRLVDALAWRLNATWYLGEYRTDGPRLRLAYDVLARSPDPARQAYTEGLDAFFACQAAGMSLEDLQRCGDQAIRAVELAEATGDDDTVAAVLTLAGAVVMDLRGDTKGEMFQRALVRARSAGDESTEAIAGINLAELLLTGGDGAGARQVAERALTCAVVERSPAIRSNIQSQLGASLLLLGEPDRAEPYLVAAAEWASWSRDALALAELTMRFAGIAALRGQDHRAAALSGAHEKLCADLGIHWTPSSSRIAQSLLLPLEERLGAEAFAAQQSRGAGLSLEDAVAAALDPAWPPGGMADPR